MARWVMSVVELAGYPGRWLTLLRADIECANKWKETANKTNDKDGTDIRRRSSDTDDRAAAATA